MVRWPGVVRPGSTCDVPVISTDFYPTLAEMAGIKKDRATRRWRESVPLLTGEGNSTRTALYWHLPHNGKHAAHPGNATPAGQLQADRFLRPARYGQS